MEEEEINYWDNSKYAPCQYATRLLDKLRKMNEEVNRPIDIDEVRKAIYYAKKYHGSQMRQSGEPYYSHPLEVAYMISDYLFRTDIIVTSGQFIMTNQECQTGTERVYEAFQLIPNNHHINYILNVQGDMPFVEPESIIKVIESLKSSSHDIMTPVVKVGIDAVNGHSNVKVITDHNDKALYFSRNLIPHGAEEFLYHVGMYGFRKEALTKFINLPVSTLELSEKLEQLRASQNNMSIGVCYVNNIPISVDTIEDLNKAIEFYQKNIS